MARWWFIKWIEDEVNVFDLAQKILRVGCPFQGGHALYR
jgi:hypothetical protein